MVAQRGREVGKRRTRKEGREDQGGYETVRTIKRPTLSYTYLVASSCAAQQQSMVVESRTISSIWSTTAVGPSSPLLEALPEREGDLCITMTRAAG
jgi:hypothetical protein